MYRTRISDIRGFSLVELLVAMVIAVIGSIIIFQVFAGFEGQRRVTTSGGDATTALAAASNAIDQAGREAGFGLNFGSHLGCDAIGWRENADPTELPHVAGKVFAQKLTPVSIKRKTNGELEYITFSRNSNDISYSVTQLDTPMIPNTPPTAATPEDPLCLKNNFGVIKGDVLVLAEKKNPALPKITCAFMEVRDFVTDARCPRRMIVHDYGSFVSDDPDNPGTKYTNFNKPGGLGTIPDAGASGTGLDSLDSSLDSPPRNAPVLFSFKAGAFVMNLGPKIGKSTGLRSTTFSLGNNPAINSGQLLVSNFPGDPGTALMDGVVFMDAQFGSASSPADMTSALTYSKMLPEVAANDPKISQATWFSLRTVRFVLIVRSSQPDKDYTSPATITTWSPPLDVTYTVPAADIHHRHKVVELVIPLRNVIWRPKK